MEMMVRLLPDGTDPYLQKTVVRTGTTRAPRSAVRLRGRSKGLHHRQRGGLSHAEQQQLKALKSALAALEEATDTMHSRRANP